MNLFTGIFLILFAAKIFGVFTGSWLIVLLPLLAAPAQILLMVIVVLIKAYIDAE